MSSAKDWKTKKNDKSGKNRNWDQTTKPPKKGIAKPKSKDYADDYTNANDYANANTNANDYADANDNKSSEVKKETKKKELKENKGNKDPKDHKDKKTGKTGNNGKQSIETYSFTKKRKGTGKNSKKYESFSSGGTKTKPKD